MAKNSFKKTAALLAAAAVLAANMVTAFAAGEGTGEAASYGYQIGQRQNSERHAQFEAVAGFTTDAEREAYFAAQEIGGDGPHSAAPHLDAGQLVEAGIIDQATADKIAAYASQKHDDLHSRFAGLAGMTQEQRQALFESRKDGYAGDDAGELLDAGVITQQQADAISAYLSDTLNP